MPTTAKKPASRAKTAKWIRNTRNFPIHLRLADAGEKRYFIELQPRGLINDIHRVPAKLLDDHTFVSSVNQGLVEILTQTEVDNIEYEPQGYQGQNGVEVEYPDDKTVTRHADWDGHGRRAPQRQIVTSEGVTKSTEVRAAPSMDAVGGAGVQMRTVPNDRRATSGDMIPAGVDVVTFDGKSDPSKRRVVVERVSG